MAQDLSGHLYFLIKGISFSSLFQFAAQNLKMSNLIQRIIPVFSLHGKGLGLCTTPQLKDSLCFINSWMEKTKLSMSF